MDSDNPFHDDLNEPLGLTAPAAKPAASRFAARWLIAPLALAALAFGGYFAMPHWRTSADPSAIAKVELAPTPKAPDGAPSPQQSADQAAALPPSASGKEIEAASGVKVVRGHNGSAPGSLILQVPDILAVHLTPAPDKRLVEKDRFGLLPKIGTDGSRAAEVYARPVMTGGRIKAGAPRIAIVLGGLGLNAASTADAIANLPGAITLGFAPYGGDVGADAAKAREAGHETLLQAPMEPFDYASNNPGPHTLLTSASAAENMDSLHWLMSRFTGYAGVGNYLGGKFSADANFFSPVLSEIAARGLFYLDDGASPRSLAVDLAANLHVQVVKADVVIDAASSADKIDAALANLETLARQHGAAVGVATALPGSIDRIRGWAARLEAKGIVLAPASSMIGRPPAAQALK